jgi:hypothetical protein
VVELARLESVYRRNPIKGSNPFPSASTFLKSLLHKSFSLPSQASRRNRRIPRLNKVFTGLAARRKGELTLSISMYQNYFRHAC